MDARIPLASPRGRLVLLASVVGSGIAFLDSTAVNIALPALGREFGAGMADFQWVVNAYLVTLAALSLPGGSLGDVHGRRRVFVSGVGLFALASVACGLASSMTFLVGARAVQGVGAALLVPNSLALLQECIRPEDRGRAIGLWSGLSGLSTLIGPLLGGWLVDTVSWRAVFLVNPALAVVVVVLALATVPGRIDAATRRRSVDSLGGAAAAVALGGLAFFLIQGPEWGWREPKVIASGALAAVALVAFLDLERSQARPMLPLELFGRAAFVGANLATLGVFFVTGGLFFLLTLQLQRVLGYSAFQAGLALAPVTLLFLVLAPASGRWSDARGPRSPMTLGPLVAAGGALLLAPMGATGRYLPHVLPGILCLGAGLGLTVAPLTATALSAAEDRHAGVASGVNDAVARIAQLLAVPLLPLAGGLGGMDRVGGIAFARGFGRAMLAAAAVLVLSAGVAWWTGTAVRRHGRTGSASPAAPTVSRR